ncbi:MAG TPA: hypothetical protein PKD55_20200 [Bellilinea sp.]|nr:hypothetical protein [Bellilinea sp.]
MQANPQSIIETITKIVGGEYREHLPGRGITVRHRYPGLARELAEWVAEALTDLHAVIIEAASEFKEFKREHPKAFAAYRAEHPQHRDWLDSL